MHYAVMHTASMCIQDSRMHMHSKQKLHYSLRQPRNPVQQLVLSNKVSAHLLTFIKKNFRTMANFTLIFITI